jgi:hypothetical protein
MVRHLFALDYESNRQLHYVGNFHALMLFTNDEELRIVTEAVHRLVHRAIALEGTCKQARSLFPLSCSIHET